MLPLSEVLAVPHMTGGQNVFPESGCKSHSGGGPLLAQYFREGIWDVWKCEVYISIRGAECCKRS